MTHKIKCQSLKANGHIQALKFPSPPNTLDDVNRYP